MAVRTMYPHQMEGLTSPPVRHLPENASESFVLGAVLISDNGSNAVEASDDPVANIIGVSGQAASGTTDDDVLFYPIMRGMLFEVSVGLTADETTGTTATNLIGDAYRMRQVTASGIWYVDITSEGTAPCVRIVEILDATTVNGRVMVEFLDDVADVVDDA